MGAGTDTLLATGTTGISGVTSLTNFEKIAFDATAAASLTLKDTLYKATYTSATAAKLEEISTLNGVTDTDLGNVLADNLDGFTLAGSGGGALTAVVAGDVLTVSGAATAKVTTGTLTSSDITATVSQANKLTVADNATVVALVATGTGVDNFNVYEITDTDAGVGSKTYQVTLMGTVTLTSGETFNDLVAASVA